MTWARGKIGWKIGVHVSTKIPVSVQAQVTTAGAAAPIGADNTVRVTIGDDPGRLHLFRPRSEFENLA